jgi:hypothetical protein
MKLKFFFLGLFFISIPTLAAETIYLDASGADGLSGQSGSSHSTHPGASSSSGDDGGAAGQSTPGHNADNIDVTIKQITTSTNKAALILSGTVRRNGVNATLALNSSTLVTADARGGKGGDGGIGGDGEGGCNGTDGHDASRYSSGTSGTSGCAGGDGGPGTPGSDGGDGGVVRAKVNIDETHLFLAFTCDISAGDGGAQGKNGDGGSGGHGGRGGSSYSWSEQVYDGEECETVSSSNGNGSYSTSRSCRSKYRTEHHSNSGGMSGSNGRSGSDGQGNIRAGNSGRNGSCVYLVDDKKGTIRTHKSKFTLSVKNFTIRDGNDDGIIEPGEKIYVENIVVQNGDGVPSPAGKSKLSLFLNSSRYILAEPVELELPQILAHASYHVPGKLPLSIKDTKPIGTETPWTDHDSITIDNTVTVVDRSVPGFETQREIQISYPIELTRFDFPKSAAADEDHTVVWAIKNVSQRDFGGESELARMVKLHFEVTEGLAKNNAFVLTDDKGQSVKIQQKYIRELLNLKAGNEIRIEGSLHVPADVLPYTDLGVQSSLRIGMNAYEDPRIIQKKSRTLRIAQTFNPNKEADIVLVTNNKTQRPEFVAWQKVFTDLHLEFAVWDLSYYGYLSLTKEFENSNTNFKRYLVNKTMVIINDPSESTESIELNLSRNEFLDAAAHSNARFVIIGGEVKELEALVTNLVIPNEKQFAQDWSLGDSLEKNSLPNNIGEALTMNMIKTYYFWNTPNEEDLSRQAEDWSQFIRNQSPREKYTFSYYFYPSQLKENWFSKTFTVGQIQIGRTLTPGGGVAITLPLKTSEIHEPRQIQSEEIYRAIILSLTPQLILKLAPAFDLQKPKIGYWLQDALIYHAIQEIDREEVFNDVGGTPPEENRWPFFKKFLEYGKLNLNSQTALLFGNLGAAVDFYNETIPAFGNYKLGRSITKIREEMKGLAKTMNYALYDSNLNAFLAKLQRNFKIRKKLLVDLRDRENARHQIIWPALNRLNTSEIMLEHNLIRKGQ